MPEGGMIDMIKLTILNDTGHTTATMQFEEVIEQIDTHPTHWIFVDGELMSRESITTLDWNTVESVDLTPAIVGGDY